MKKDIDLCGFGNGLVDIQCMVSEEELMRHEITKGAMTLVSSEEQARLLASIMNKEKFISSGGSAANTIIAFSKFGGKAAYQTVLGKDDYGKFYRKELTEMGISLRAPVINDMPTGTCLVLITPDSERTMFTNLGASAMFSIHDLDEEAIARAKWIYMEGYKFSEKSTSEAMFAATDIALKNKTKIALSFSDTFITENFKNSLMRVAEVSDLVFCNESEAQSFTKSDSTEDAFQRLCGISKSVAITRGANGSIIKWDTFALEAPAYPAKAIDSTGAGDMYAAGFLYGLISTESVDLAAHLGSYAASRIVAQIGARYRGDHIELKKKILTI